MKCRHTRTTETVHGYQGTVAVQPYTWEEPRAAGGICTTYRCLDCGAVRKVNSNGRYEETSPWRHPPRLQ